MAADSTDPVTNLVTSLARAVTLRDSSLSSLLFWTVWGNAGLSVGDTAAKQVCYRICNQFEKLISPVYWMALSDASPLLWIQHKLPCPVTPLGYQPQGRAATIPSSSLYFQAWWIMIVWCQGLCTPGSPLLYGVIMDAFCVLGLPSPLF